MASGNKYFTGNRGKLWINDEYYAEAYKAEAKRSNNYEEIADPEGEGNIQIPNGYGIEGSITIRKTGSERVLQMLKTDKTNANEYSVIIKEENPHTKATERVKYTGVTFDEFPLSQYEKRSVTEIELPFKARDYKVLQ